MLTADPGAPDCTDGTLLNGRVRYRQPAVGYRTGIEPVLLAACVPARAGQRVLEAGSGSGAALLCVAARVPGAAGCGVERDAALARIAAGNAAANGWADRLAFVPGTIQAWSPGPVFHHAMANPPWHDPAGTASPLPRRDAAKRGDAGLLDAWVRSLAASLVPRGTLSLILSAANLPDALTALAGHRCGSVAILPVWPRAGVAARLVLVQAVRGGRGAARLLPGIALHHPDGRYTNATDGILRHAAGLPLKLVSAGASARVGVAEVP